MNLLTNRNRLTDIKNKFMVTKGEMESGGVTEGLSDIHYYI